MNKIKVAIADDHMIFRKGVIMSLRAYANIEFVLEAANGNELIEGIKTSMPDVILLDLRMPGKDGIETTKHLSTAYPNIHILILTMYEDEHFVVHLMENGANGYLLKSTDPGEIKKAIVEVNSKGYYLNNFVNRILIKKSQYGSKFTPNLETEIQIKPKEKEVIRLLCREYTAQQIADEMKISPRTVESIKDRLMERFNVRNSVGLVFFAIKNRLID